jgi:hypothetical protein
MNSPYRRIVWTVQESCAVISALNQSRQHSIPETAIGVFWKLANGTGSAKNAPQTAIDFLSLLARSSRTLTSRFAIGIASFI